MDSFTHAYFVAALWSSNDESNDQGGEPLDANYELEDIAPETRDKMRADCADFQALHATLLAESGCTSEQAGHDFWLSRNGHGTGFFDRNIPGADQLQDAAEAYGKFDLCVGDDDLIYGPPPGAYGVKQTEG